MPTTRHSRAVLLVLLATHFALVLDVTIVNVALPAIERDLGISPEALHWVVSAYALAFGGALIVGGRLSDRFGHRAALALGAAVFSLASVICALATTAELLIGARALQGLGAALAEPAAMGMLAAIHPHGAMRDRALATWASVTAVAAASGLIAGGVLVQIASWEWIFFLNAPLGLAVPAAVLLLPTAAAGRGATFDVAGALLATGGLIALAAGLGGLSATRQLTPPTLALFAASATLLAAFVRRERRTTRPLVPRELVGDGRVVLALATGAIGGALVLGSFMLLPLALERELGLTPLETGLALLAARVPSMPWASVVRRMLATVGAGVTATLGMGLFVLAELSFTQIGAFGLVGAIPGLLLVGLAVPCVFMSTSRIALGRSEAHEVGLASGLLGAAQFLGGSLGLAVIAFAAADGLAAASASLAAGFWACLALASVGAVTAILTSLRAGVPALSAA